MSFIQASSTINIILFTPSLEEILPHVTRRVNVPKRKFHRTVYRVLLPNVRFSVVRQMISFFITNRDDVDLDTSDPNHMFEVKSGPTVEGCSIAKICDGYPPIPTALLVRRNAMPILLWENVRFV